jgi:anti-sigma B factor antagonist
VPTESLTITIGSDDRSCTVTLAGDLDPVSAPHLEGELQASVFTTDCERLVLDLEAVRFIDSAGLSVILKALKLMRARDGSLVLRKPNPTVSRLLEVTALTGQLVIE